MAQAIYSDTAARSPKRGLLLMLLGTALFSILNGVVKAQMEVFPVNQVVFFRNAFALVPLFFMVLASRQTRPFKSEAPWQQLALAVLFTLSLVAVFLSYALMTLADATAINFTQPVMVILIAVIFRVEAVRKADMLAVALGMAGIAIILLPQESIGQSAIWGILLGLVGAFLSAASNLQQRQLSQYDGTALIAFASLGLSAVLVAPTLAFSWVSPTAWQLAGLIGMGLVSGLCQYVTTRAFYHSTASSLSSANYTKMIWAVLIGYLWFGEVPSIWMLLGSAVILCSALVSMRR